MNHFILKDKMNNSNGINAWNPKERKSNFIIQ